MALPTQMPFHGSASTPKFDGKTPLLLPRFLEDVEIIGTATTLTDAEKVQTSSRYANLEESEGWELLPEAIVIPVDWAAFTHTVKALYPGCEGANPIAKLTFSTSSKNIGPSLCRPLLNSVNTKANL
jgi:hypothetical protein